MKIITFNANGIRSAARKDFFTWMKHQRADFVCMQETRAQMTQLHDEVFYPKSYHHYFVDAQKKGYSGVGIYCKQEPNEVINHLGYELADDEGRFIEVQYDKLSVASIYFPSGTSGDHRQTLKMEFLAEIQQWLKKQLATKRQVVVCGDVNIVHKEIDIKNWKSNQKNSGCLPEERAWLDLIFDQMGWVDAFRAVNQQPDQYTWWSNRGNAYANNVGWRIDYQIVTPNLKNKIIDAKIYKQKKFSDHAPLIMNYDIDY